MMDYACTRTLILGTSCHPFFYLFFFLVFFSPCRSLTANPHAHHAEHLNAIRKEVSSNPLSLLRAFRKSKETNTEREQKRATKKGNKDEDTETTSMYDVSNEGTEGSTSSMRDPASSRRSSWTQMFSRKDDKAKMFMAETS